MHDPDDGCDLDDARSGEHTSGARELSAALRTATFTRRVLSHEDQDAILDTLRETATEWLGADGVVVTAGEGASRPTETVPVDDAHSVLVQEVSSPQPVALGAWAARRDAFDAWARVDARVLVEVTAVALEAARKLRLFHDAVARRDMIGRAKGMLSERYGVDDERAFALLRRLSQERNRRLVDVAADVTAGRLLHGRSGAASADAARTPA